MILLSLEEVLPGLFFAHYLSKFRSEAKLSPYKILLIEQQDLETLGTNKSIFINASSLEEHGLESAIKQAENLRKEKNFRLNLLKLFNDRLVQSRPTGGFDLFSIPGYNHEIDYCAMVDNAN